MDIALIPPAQHLHFCVGRHMQMIIPANLKNTEYAEFYRKLPYNKGKVFLMLDCGAYEDDVLSYQDLIELARDYAVSEIIPPDTLGNTDTSWKQLNEFLSYMRHPSHVKTGASIMVPVQAPTLEQCYRYVDRVAQIAAYNGIYALGLPKHLPDTTNRPEARIALLHYIRWNFPFFSVHFLGYNNPDETRQAAEYGARSMDTSMPFVVAAAGALLSDPLDKLSRKREMELREKTCSENLVIKNIEMLDRWANVGNLVRALKVPEAKFSGEQDPNLSNSTVVKG